MLSWQRQWYQFIKRFYFLLKHTKTLCFPVLLHLAGTTRTGDRCVAHSFQIPSFESPERSPLSVFILVCLLHMHVCCVLSCSSLVQLHATPWTVAGQSPLSMGFSTQECRSGLPCTPPGDLPDQGIEPMSLRAPGLAGFTTSTIWETLICMAWRKRLQGSGVMW